MNEMCMHHALDKPGTHRKGMFCYTITTRYLPNCLTSTGSVVYQFYTKHKPFMGSYKDKYGQISIFRKNI